MTSYGENTLLRCPREVRDMILEFVHMDIPIPACKGHVHNLVEGSEWDKSSFFRKINVFPTVLVNNQLREETADAIRRLGKRNVLDLNIGIVEVDGTSQPLLTWHLPRMPQFPAEEVRVTLRYTTKVRDMMVKKSVETKLLLKPCVHCAHSCMFDLLGVNMSIRDPSKPHQILTKTVIFNVETPKYTRLPNEIIVEIQKTIPEEYWKIATERITSFIDLEIRDSASRIIDTMRVPRCTRSYQANFPFERAGYNHILENEAKIEEDDSESTRYQDPCKDGIEQCLECNSPLMLNGDLLYRRSWQAVLKPLQDCLETGRYCRCPREKMNDEYGRYLRLNPAARVFISANVEQASN
ncbi:hypothetical protein BJ878DRAFT_542102 [Calycina marina]|uniref:Uncharacterized protein n=1 Tax=Calycina marina TaxID=1763456 RepID=A0A9P7Z490_9HELO|nr:hypothetical protein BJ878DRAFT_542102 [Calycina marina]